MAQEPGSNSKRINIQYFEGVNATVQHAISRNTELSHMENARAPIIGVLEKREGQVVLGTDENGDELITYGNFGLFHFDNDYYSTSNQGLVRISSLDGNYSNILLLDDNNQWIDLFGDIFENAICDFVNVEGYLIVVDGTNNTIFDPGFNSYGDSGNPGSLYNSPDAKRVAYYKSRIYLADYYDNDGNELKTTVLRSSYSMGIISLVNGDVESAIADLDIGGDTYWEIPVTDNKYFYSDSGMNEYEIYRGSQLIAYVTIDSFTETKIIASSGNVSFQGSFHSFLSSDEIWIAGTYEGQKQYRWINNSSSTGRDVKQYDTFKLSGGDESAITMLEPVGNILMIANNNSMLTWNDYNLENFDLGIGCSSPNGYVKLRGSIYFIHYSGIYSTSGSTPQLLSRKIERYLKGVTKDGFEEAAVGYKGLSVFFTVGDVTLYNNDGSLWKVLPNVCFEFSTADQNWYVHTNVSASQFENFIGTDGQERLAACSLTVASNSSLGPELITNGTFTGSADGWDLGTGWSYEDNSVIYNNNNA